MSQLNNYVSWWWNLLSNNDLITYSMVTILALVLATLWFKLSRSNYSPPLPPGPRSLPIVGYLPFLSPDMHIQFTNMAQTYGPIFKLKMGRKLYVVINTPELVKEVVRDQDEVFANHDLTVAADVITYGGQDIIFSKYNSYWRNLRKVFVQETLSFKNLAASSSFRRDGVRKTIKNVFGRIGTSINITEISFLTEANVLTRMVWGNSSYKGENEDPLELQLLDLTVKINEIFGRPNTSDFFPILAWFDLQGVRREMKEQLDKFDRIVDRIIEDRIESNAKMSRDEVAGDVEGKKDFLQILLDLQNKKDAAPLNLTQIKALVLDIMTAGTETTATLLEWAGAELLRDPNLMKKAQKELEEIVGLDNMVEEYHLPKLKYLDAVIKEAHRLHTVVPFMIPRSPSKDCVIGGYTIPKGSTVLLNAWAIHRDPRYWNNPLEFNPERFLNNDEIGKWDYKGNNMSFFPFGSGRRLCAGLPLAEKMQMFILASLLHSFDWNLPHGEEHDLSERFGITIKKRKPLVAVPSRRLSDASLYL